MAKTQSIRFFSLSRQEGLFLREITVVHRNSVNSIAMSQNGGYLLSAGDDKLLKMWDYSQKNSPYFFQAFIGHTFAVEQVMFNPCDNSMIFSKAGKDGVHVWKFNGDTQTNFMPRVEEGPFEVKGVDPDKAAQPTVLEQMRAAAKARKAVNKIPETSFLVPAYQKVQTVDSQPP